MLESLRKEWVSQLWEGDGTLMDFTEKTHAVFDALLNTDVNLKMRCVITDGVPSARLCFSDSKFISWFDISNKVDIMKVFENLINAEMYTGKKEYNGSDVVQTACAGDIFEYTFSGTHGYDGKAWAYSYIFHLFYNIEMWDSSSFEFAFEVLWVVSENEPLCSDIYNVLNEILEIAELDEHKEASPEELIEVTKPLFVRLVNILRFD